MSCFKNRTATSETRHSLSYWLTPEEGPNVSQETAQTLKVVAPYIVRKSKIAGPDSETIVYWWTLTLSKRAKLLALTVKLQHTGPRAVIVLTPYITKLKAVGPDSETTAYWTQLCKGSGPVHQKEQNHWPWQWNYDLLDQEMLKLWPCTSERAKLLAWQWNYSLLDPEL